MGYQIVGKKWTAEQFEKYIQTVKLGWANSVTVHHTASPSLAQRPQGWLSSHLSNLKHFYQRVLKWSRGPHLFTDEDEIWGMSSLWERGVHAVSFNKDSIGIETLGNYDTEDPTSGRGLQCWTMTAAATAIILKRMGREPNENTVKFHRDDPRTSKTCPGRKVQKRWFLDLVRAYFDKQAATPALSVEERLKRIEKHLEIK